jgi:hypothetical protein
VRSPFNIRGVEGGYNHPRDTDRHGLYSTVWLEGQAIELLSARCEESLQHQGGGRGLQLPTGHR